MLYVARRAGDAAIFGVEVCASQDYRWHGIPPHPPALLRTIMAGMGMPGKSGELAARLSSRARPGISFIMQKMED